MISINGARIRAARKLISARRNYSLETPLSGPPMAIRSSHRSSGRQPILGGVDRRSRIVSRTRPDKQLSPAVTFDGENFLVAWQITRFAILLRRCTDIYGTRVSPDGEVRSTTRMDLVASP